MPESVTVAMAELTGDLRAGLLALAVGTGLQVMRAVMEEDVVALVGRKGRHDPGRRAVRQALLHLGRPRQRGCCGRTFAAGRLIG